MIWLWLVIIGMVVGAVVLLLLARRRPRPEERISEFQRHISALSPEARREVMDRVRPPEDGS